MSHSLGDVKAVEPVTDPYGGGLTKEDFEVADRWPSKTRGHEHVVLRLSERLVIRAVTSVPEGLLLEACFGSDPRRALLAYRRWPNGVEEPSRLFKPTRPTTHERKEE